jgi:rRNA maturation RNase YbeY
VKKGSIYFFSEEIRFALPKKRKTRDWIREALLKEKKSLVFLNFIFCSDDHLSDLNIKFLNHKSLTDILTFDYSEMSNQVSGDIYISVDRVKENSKTYNCGYLTEMHRVIIHGVLHLVGYKDKTSEEAEIMRKKEDYYLSLRKNFIHE